MEWCYFRFDNIQDGGWRPSWNDGAVARNPCVSWAFLLRHVLINLWSAKTYSGGSDTWQIEMLRVCRSPSEGNREWQSFGLVTFRWLFKSQSHLPGSFATCRQPGLLEHVAKARFRGCGAVWRPLFHGCQLPSWRCQAISNKEYSLTA